jgi:molecular chaperone GrpE
MPIFIGSKWNFLISKPFCPIKRIGKIIAAFRNTMFFQKKKNMSNNTNANNENADNLAHEEEINKDAMADFTDLEGDEKINQNNEEIEKLRADVAELKDKNMRLIAEFDNFRRRNAKERLELVQTAGKDTIQSLLVVMDDMDRAAKQLEKVTDINLLKEGVSLVFNKFRTILQQKGLREMDATNKEFDAELHEAITEIPAPSENMVGKVMDVVEPGYYLNDKLIRHAKVVVGK